MIRRLGFRHASQNKGVNKVGAVKNCQINEVLAINTGICMNITVLSIQLLTWQGKLAVQSLSVRVRVLQHNMLWSRPRSWLFPCSYEAQTVDASQHIVNQVITEPSER